MLHLSHFCLHLLHLTYSNVVQYELLPVAIVVVLLLVVGLLLPANREMWTNSRFRHGFKFLDASEHFSFDFSDSIIELSVLLAWNLSFSEDLSSHLPYNNHNQFKQ